MVAIHPPGLNGLLGCKPAVAGVLTAVYTVVVLGSVLVLVALAAPLLERCPWERGQQFVRPGAHRGGLSTWSMRADVRTKPFGAVAP